MIHRHFFHGLVFTLLLTGLPAVPVCWMSAQVQEAAAEVNFSTEFSTECETAVENAEVSRPEKQKLPVTYRVLLSDSGEILEVPLQEYLVGVVGAEMPASFALEALKAQTIAAHTYAEYQRQMSRNRDYDISDDPARHQAFLTREQLREKWGESFNRYFAKLSTAVESVVESLLIYDEEPIIAAFCAMSAGRTESAENVWGCAVPYLQPVESASDKDAPHFEEQKTFSAEQVRSCLEGCGFTLTGELPEWFGSPEVSESGTVLVLPIGDGTLTGQEVCRLFGLRSAAFTLQTSASELIFTTHGFGHGVGMSQYGANAMALEGYSCQEILAYYYPGTELQ